MPETLLSLEKFQWQASQDKTHQYSVCEPQTRSEFEHLVTYIRKYGYVITIQGKAYACVDIGEYLYWTMWSSIEETNSINRMQICQDGAKEGDTQEDGCKVNATYADVFDWILHLYGFKRPVK